LSADKVTTDSASLTQLNEGATVPTGGKLMGGEALVTLNSLEFRSAFFFGVVFFGAAFFAVFFFVVFFVAVFLAVFLFTACFFTAFFFDAISNSPLIRLLVNSTDPCFQISSFRKFQPDRMIGSRTPTSHPSY
jgi:hypothetical protein